MTYAVKEIFYTLQGEGMRAGRPAVFCRFAGCNLWTGREQDRATATCKFCDTEFVGTDGERGGKYDALSLAKAINDLWPHEKEKKRAATPYVVFTGGEPLLQLDDPLTDEVHKYGFEIAIESNGTLPVPTGVDWICISPKAGAPLVQTRGSELKLVYPQEGAEPERFTHLTFDHFLLQPMWGDKTEENMAAAARYCMAHPRWRLSLQTHKWAGLK